MNVIAAKLSYNRRCKRRAALLRIRVTSGNDLTDLLCAAQVKMMSKLERGFLVVCLLFISVAAISWVGKEFHALLAMFEVLVGVIIGMLLFLPNR